MRHVLTAGLRQVKRQLMAGMPVPVRVMHGRPDERHAEWDRIKEKMERNRRRLRLMYDEDLRLICYKAEML